MKGFTLIELILVIVILGILAVIGSSFLQAGLSNYATNQRLANANWQGRIALENMARRIMAIRASADITTATTSSLQFIDNDALTISYQLSGSILQSTVAANTQPLADGVSSLSFAYYNRNLVALSAPVATPSNIRYIQIDLVITLNNVNYTFRTLVALRNLE